jgi:uncharacterized protein (TIRG00374 family)
MLGRSRYLGFLITGAFVILLVWKTDLHELSAALASANYFWVALIIACTVSSYVLRTVRWRRILHPTRQLPFRALLPVLFIGFMANNLLPARIGEIVRAYALGQKTGLSKSLGLATILVERLCDGVTLVAVLGVVALLFPLPTWGRQAAYIAGGLFLFALILSFVVLAREERAIQVLSRVSSPLPTRLAKALAEKAAAFVVGLRALRSGRNVLFIAGWSAVIWSIETMSYLMVMKSFHPTLTRGTPLLAALLMMVMVNLGTLIPSAPGYVGVFQWFGVMALSAFGVPAGVALAISIVSHAAQWVTVTGIGLAFVARESMNLKTLAVKDVSSAASADATGGPLGA